MNMETRNDHHLNIFEPNLRCWLVQVDPTGIALNLDRENSSWTLGDLPYEPHGSILSWVIPPKNGGFLLIWRYFGEIFFAIPIILDRSCRMENGTTGSLRNCPITEKQPTAAWHEELRLMKSIRDQGDLCHRKEVSCEHSSFGCHPSNICGTFDYMCKFQLECKSFIEL